MVKVTEINPNHIDPFKLSLISYGSLCGMGIGLLFGLFRFSLTATFIMAVLLLGIGGYAIFKNISYLLR